MHTLVHKFIEDHVYFCSVRNLGTSLYNTVKEMIHSLHIHILKIYTYYQIQRNYVLDSHTEMSAHSDTSQQFL